MTVTTPVSSRANAKVAKRAGRPKDSRKQIEARVNQITESISKLTKMVQNNAHLLNARQIESTFEFLQRKLAGSYGVCQASLAAPVKDGGFSLNTDASENKDEAGAVTITIPIIPVQHSIPKTSQPRVSQTGVVTDSNGRPEGRLAGAAKTTLDLTDDEMVDFLSEDE